MKRIAVVTSTRAEYGILSPLIKRIDDDRELKLELIVTGSHLCEKYGHTIDEIEHDGFKIDAAIPILEEGNSEYDISLSMANAISKFAHYFQNNHPDMLILLGDRTEILAIAIAAMNERIPIAHIHGGELTMGAVDDCVRHALTKMSLLHFPTTKEYRNRIIQMGEAPNRVFNYGALSTENILKQTLLNEDEIRRELGINKETDYCVMTFHPVTLEKDTAMEQVKEICKVMDAHEDLLFVITMANSDVGGDIVNRLMKEYSDEHSNTKPVSSLGMRKYLSAVKYSSFVIGNSSSGVIEAPVLGIPTVNIGDRQKGRLMAETVINCKPEYDEINRAIDVAMNMEHKPSLLFGDGNTSIQIVDTIKKYLAANNVELKKEFFDLNMSYQRQ